MDTAYEALYEAIDEFHKSHLPHNIVGNRLLIQITDDKHLTLKFREGPDEDCRARRLIFEIVDEDTGKIDEGYIDMDKADNVCYCYDGDGYWVKNQHKGEVNFLPNTVTDICELIDFYKNKG